LGKRNPEEDSNEKSSWKRYAPWEKATCNAKRASETIRKGVPEGQKVEHTSFKEPDSGIHKEEMKKRQETDGCTLCSIPGHKWKNCRLPIQVSTIGGRKLDNGNRGTFHPKFQPRKPEVAAVAD